MNEFAYVLQQIIEWGKKNRIFSIKTLAQQAGITASYISNLKQANQSPPTPKTLHKLVTALRHFHVKEQEIQRLEDAYAREQRVAESGGGFFDRLAKTLEQDAPLSKGETVSPFTMKAERVSDTGKETARTENCRFGEYSAFLAACVDVFRQIKELQNPPQEIYMTAFHQFSQASPDKNHALQRQFALQELLRTWASTKVIHLWCGAPTVLLADFLAQYANMRHQVLYSLPHGHLLPEYLLIEQIGFVEAKPVAENRYLIRTVLRDVSPPPQSDETVGLMEYLKHLIHQGSQTIPLVQTDNTASSPQEQAHETLHIEASLLNAHCMKTMSQKGRYIHEEFVLKEEFRASLTMNETAHLSGKLETALFKERILGILQTLTRNPDFHVGLSERKLPMNFTLTSDNAHFQSHQHGDVITGTSHPEVLYQLRQEFYDLWNSISPQRRTDSQTGRLKVGEFLVTEALLALISPNSRPESVDAFLTALIEAVPTVAPDAFIQKLYTLEQSATHIWHICHSLPLITIPASLGPWDATSSARTYQRLLTPILAEVDEFQVLAPQTGIEQYWQSGRYGYHFLSQEERAAHVQTVQNLLADHSPPVHLDILAAPLRFTVEIAIIDQRHIFLSHGEKFEEQGGVILCHDELAHTFIAYLEALRTSSAGWSETNAVAEWLKNTLNIVERN